MEKVIFKLKDQQTKFEKNPASQKPTLVYLIFSYGYYTITDTGKKKYISVKYSTGLKIKPHQWNNNTYRAKQTSTFDYQNFNTALENFETSVKNIHRKNYNYTPQQIKTELDKEFKKKNNTAIADSLNGYIDKFINDIETGTKKTINKTNYKLGTIKAYRTFRNKFFDYQKEKRKTLDFNNITIDFYNDYTNYLSKRDLNPNSIGKHITLLKAIMNDAKELKLHNNTEINRKAFKSIKTDVENIYLSESEIKDILNLELSDKPNLDLARDVFLVGCYTAQRYSDYSIINKNNIKIYDNVEYIELTQIKTGEKVVIPIKPELKTILKKYNYNLPKTYEQKVNKYIKEIGSLAGINTSTETITIKSGLEVKKYVSKYRLITTHTARRSGATNMYLAGIPTIDIMKFTGHKTPEIFLKYIKVTKQETAENLSIHPYFSSMVAN